ncbi:MAG: (Fe-S)-binding protein [Hydrogenibacillus sp.]|nr:(Fe-S)-binding protein [Hydrogenibacillus sp.]
MEKKGRAAVPTTGGFPYPDPPRSADYDVCVHCGMCLEACPTYLELGHEHQSPRGRVYLIKMAAEGKIALGEAFRDPIFTCLDCRACETACPSGVPVGRLIETARGQLFRADPPKGFRKWVHDLILRQLFPHPKRLDRLASLLIFYQKSGLERAVRALRLTRVLPKHLAALERVLPAVGRSVRRAYPEELPAARGPAKDRRPAGDAFGARPPAPTLASEASERPAPPSSARPTRVGVFTGCVMDVFFTDVNAATVRVLRRNGYDVVIPKDQRCCGALHIHAGDREQGKALARANIDAFGARAVDAVVVNAAGCGAALKEYGELLRDDPEYRARAAAFSARVKDISEFLYAFGFRPPEGAIEATVTYHDACHLAHAQRVREAPRAILRSIPGLKLVEMQEADHCCGSAGVYNLTHPEMAEALLRRKVANIPENAAYVAMGNPGCMLQIAAGLARDGQSGRVVHTVTLLDQAYMKEGDG